MYCQFPSLGCLIYSTFTYVIGLVFMHCTRLTRAVGMLFPANNYKETRQSACRQKQEPEQETRVGTHIEEKRFLHACLPTGWVASSVPVTMWRVWSTRFSLVQCFDSMLMMYVGRREFLVRVCPAEFPAVLYLCGALPFNYCVFM